MHRVRNGIIAGVALLLGAGAVAHAQSSGYGSSGSSGMYSSPSKASVKSHAAAHKKIVATEVNNKYVFSPKGATVKVGTQVTWTNTSDAAHSVTSDEKAWQFDRQRGAGKGL